MKKVKVFESKCMNNEVTLEELDKNLRQTAKLASDNEQKLDELSRKLCVQEDELKRANERADLAENKLKGIEEELESVGENMKSLERSAERSSRSRRFPMSLEIPSMTCLQTTKESQSLQSLYTIYNQDQIFYIIIQIIIKDP